MHCFLASVVYFVYKKLDDFHKAGVINYLPVPIQNFFLKISIFDVLCNIWFVPRISLYVKRLFLPFFVNMNREEAYKMFYELDPRLAETLDTKGVINILPENISKLIMPKDGELTKPIKLLAPEESINTIKYSENAAVWTKSKTELISSGSRNEPLSNQKREKNLDKISNLEPIFIKILRSQFKQLVSFLSHRTLAASSILAGVAILTQVLFSKYARTWLVTWIKFSVLSGSFTVLFGSFLGLLIKFLNKNLEEPKRNLDQIPKIFKGIRPIKSRFNSKADKNSFFTPDLKIT
jgi:hypothetical protein